MNSFDYAEFIKMAQELQGAVDTVNVVLRKLHRNKINTLFVLKEFDEAGALFPRLYLEAHCSVMVEPHMTPQ